MPTKDELEAQLFRRGKEVLGKSSGGLIAQLYRSKGRDIGATSTLIELAAKKENPREFICRVLTPLQEAQRDNATTLNGGNAGGYHRV